MTDIQALRDHLLAEAEGARWNALKCQRRAEQHCGNISHNAWRRAQWWAESYAMGACTATDAWLAADTRLRTLDALIAAHGEVARLTAELDDVYAQACGGCFAIPAGRAEWRCK